MSATKNFLGNSRSFLLDGSKLSNKRLNKSNKCYRRTVDKVRFISRDLPLDFHEKAFQASRAVRESVLLLVEI